MAESSDEGRKLGRSCLAGCLIAVGAVVAIVIVVVVIVAVTGGDDDDKSVDRQKGFHCLSAWDGHHTGFERLIREQLKDPESMETDQTWISPVNAEGNHRITMEYRARNSFGGVVEARATGLVDNETCEAVVLSIE